MRKQRNIPSWRAPIYRLAMMVGLVVLCCMPDLRHAAAMDQFDMLHTPAIAVRAPSQAFLIGLTAAGARLVAVGEHGLIIYSDDDGVTWRQANVPVGVSITTIAFATAQEGWAAGAFGVILHTVDGGANWTVQTTGVQVNRLMTATAAQFSAADPTAESAQTALRRAGIFAAAGPDKPFLSILPLSSNDVFVFGAYRMCVKTMDGGKSWADCSLDIGDAISHNLYGAAKIGQSLYLAGEAGMVFRSDNPGGGFSRLPSPAASTFFGLLAGKANRLLVYGVAGRIFYTDDNGKNWAPANIATDSDVTAGVVLKSGSILVVTESGNIFVSSDNGANFRMVGRNMGMALFGVVQAADGDAVLIGASGVRVLPSAPLT